MKEAIEDFFANVVFPLFLFALMATPFVLFAYFLASEIDKSRAQYTTYREFYTSMGILAEHELNIIDPTKNELNGSISGSGGYMIFLAAGSFEGTVRTEDMIQFEWVIPTGGTQISTVPYRMVIWDFSEEHTTPSFKFNFTQEKLGWSVRKDTEIINFNSVFEEADAITIHTTRAQYDLDVLSKIAP